MVAWWLYINERGLVNGAENYTFGIFEGFFAILCGLTGLTKGKAWGSFKSYVGKAIMFISLGFIAWGLGNLIIGYYNLVLQLAYPYPSLADLAYIVSWPLWLIGIFNLSRATGVKFRIRSLAGKLSALLIMIFAIALSYYLLIVVARQGVFDVSNEGLLRLFFDFAYPVGDVVILTSAFLILGLLIHYLGGVLKIPILLIIFGFLLNYAADIVFTYTNTIGTFYVANWVDLLYTTAFLFLGIGVNLFDQKTLIRS